MVETPVSLLEQLNSTNNAAAWERFVQLYHPLLAYWSQKFCHDKTERQDFQQELYIKLLRALPNFQYQKTKRFRGWLWTTTLNLWRDQIRRRSSQQPMLSFHPDDAVTWPEENALDEAEYRRYLINRMMELMKKEFDHQSWQACWEVACQGRPVTEVAAELGMTANAVYIARCRIIKRIREELHGMLDD